MNRRSIRTSLAGPLAALLAAMQSLAGVIVPADTRPVAVIGGVLALPLEGSPERWPEGVTLQRADGGAPIEGSVAWIGTAAASLERSWTTPEQALDVRPIARAPADRPHAGVEVDETGRDARRVGRGVDDAVDGAVDAGVGPEVGDEVLVIEPRAGIDDGNDDGFGVAADVPGVGATDVDHAVERAERGIVRRGNDVADVVRLDVFAEAELPVVRERFLDRHAARKRDDLEAAEAGELPVDAGTEFFVGAI